MDKQALVLTSGPDEALSCANALLRAIQGAKGIVAAEIDRPANLLTLRFDPEKIPLNQARQLAERVAQVMGQQFEWCAGNPAGPFCQTCALALRQPAGSAMAMPRLLPGGDETHLAVTLDQPAARLGQVEQRIQAPAYKPRPGEEQAGQGRQRAILTALSLACLALGWLTGWLELPLAIQLSLYAVSYATGGWFGAIEGLQALRERTLDVNVLMVIAALGAAAIGEWPEGAILLFLFSLSGTLEEFAMGRTQQAIRALMQLRPDTALVRRDGWEMLVPVEQLRRGDIVLVKPGERIPSDGIVVAGESAVDQSPITGESIPVTRRSGDPVYAGTVNQQGALEIQVTRLANETTLAKIIKLVAEAQSERAPTQRLIDTFGDRYALSVIAGSLLLMVVPMLLLDWPFRESFYRAMTLLVVASPCALVISTPASILSAIANAARHGILFKGGAHLENLSNVRVIVFDKTGTLTTGKPEVTDVLPLDGGCTPDELLRLAASVEQRSEHPLAAAVVRAAWERGLRLDEVSEVKAVPGLGVHARVNGDSVSIGNERLFAQQGEKVAADLADQLARLEMAGKTTMIISNGHVQGIIAVADQVRPSARQVIARLKRLGIDKIVILTGDNLQVAKAIAAQLGIDEVHAELLPEDKVRIVKELAARHGKVAVVGDGVNDAPALATATVGIAMGAAGTDVALETADVVLMADDLSRLPHALALSRQARRIIRPNRGFAGLVILTLIASTLLGHLLLPVGVVGHEGSTLVVVSNGLRLLGFKINESAPKRPLRTSRRGGWRLPATNSPDRNRIQSG